MAANAARSSETEDQFLIRRLELGDKSKGFINLLSQLSPCPQISDAQFQLRFHELVSLANDHMICAVTPSMTRPTAGSSPRGPSLRRRSSSRSCGKVGHIGDVVVDSGVSGKKLGQKVVNYLVDHAKRVGWYKVILDCTPELRGFYEKCGFLEKNVQMAINF